MKFDPSRAAGLLVGIEDYKASSLTSLTGPAADARRFAEWLLSMKVPNHNIFMFVNGRGDAVDAMRKKGVFVAPPTEAGITQFIFEKLETLEPEFFFMAWSGHGFSRDGRQHLFYEDAVESRKLCLEFEGLLAAMKCDRRAAIRNQVFVVDACASYLREDTHEVAGLAPTAIPRGQQRGHVSSQIALYSSRPGRQAMNDSGGIFSSFLLRRLHNRGQGGWPDFETLAEEADREKELKRQGPWHYFYGTPRRKIDRGSPLSNGISVEDIHVSVRLVGEQPSRSVVLTLENTWEKGLFAIEFSLEAGVGLAFKFDASRRGIPLKPGEKREIEFPVSRWDGKVRTICLRSLFYEYEGVAHPVGPIDVELELR